MEFKDYYSTLGLAKTATDKELKQAYRKLARKLHPDVNPGDKTAEARFKEINEAYEVLGDSDKRQKYDELGANWRAYEQAERAGGSPFGDARWTVNTGRSPAGFRTIDEEEMRRVFGEEEPFSDFFKMFFDRADPGTGRRGRTPRSARGRAGGDVEHSLDLSLEEALGGTTRRISIKHAGHTRTVDVRIPLGVGDGSRVRVAGEGQQGSGGAASGDLYLTIRMLPHLVFERRGQDLTLRLKVPLTIAVLGGEAEVPTLDARPLRLKIPPGTQNGQVFRLKGHGMPRIGKPDDRGDLYASVDVQIPRHLTPDERRHYEALAQVEGPRTP